MSEIEQPFPQLRVEFHLGWHRSQERDECHAWLRDRMAELAPCGKMPATQGRDDTSDENG